MVRHFRCFLCEADTTEPSWREGDFGTRVPICPSCRRDGGDGKR